MLVLSAFWRVVCGAACRSGHFIIFLAVPVLLAQPGKIWAGELSKPQSEPVQITGENPPLLFQDESVSITLMQMESDPGSVSLTVLCRNEGEEERYLLLITPRFNGKPAAFDHGWGSQELLIPAGQEREEGIPMMADDPDEIPESLEFRVAAEGKVSSPCRILLSAEGSEVKAASFEAGAGEPPLVDPVIDFPVKPSDAPYVLADVLTPEQAERLDYGQALICIRTEDEDGEHLSHISTVKAEVDEDGHVTASYSGLALSLSENPDFLITTVESFLDWRPHLQPMRPEVSFGPSGGRTGGSASPVALSGEAAFYATLSFQLCELKDGQMLADKVVVSSEELGGDLGNVPCALFDNVQTSREIWKVTERETEGIMLEVVRGENVSWDIQRPLTFRLIPAENLGELMVCFEYFFMDNSDIIHPPESIA